MDMLPIATADEAPPAFDYATLPAEMVSRQQERATRIRDMYRQTVETAGEIGRELLAAQGEMDHGQFLPWVTGAVGLSKSTAYRCMDMARSFGSKLPTVGSLPLAVVHKLSEKSTPEPLRAAVLRRIEAGETVKADAILDEVREAKETARKQAAVEKETVRREALSEEQRAEEDALRARGEKGRAARERKEERERQARLAEERHEDARAAPIAAFLVDRLGADASAALLHKSGSLLGRALSQAGALAQARRAQHVGPTEISVAAVNRYGLLSEYRRDPEAEAEAAALAEQIQGGAAFEPVTVVAERGHYDVVAGHNTFRALADVLRRSKIPVRIAPPIDPDTIHSLSVADG